MKSIAYSKLSQLEQVNLREAILSLRYGPTKANRRPKLFKSLADISKALKVPYHSVQHICRYKYKPAKSKRYGGQHWKLEQEHVAFLLSEDTLKKWAGFTMKERITLFHRRFMNKKIAVTSLRRLYLNNKVKRKKVRQHKGVPPQTLIDFPMNR